MSETSPAVSTYASFCYSLLSGQFQLKLFTVERAAKTLHRMSPCTPVSVLAKITCSVKTPCTPVSVLAKITCSVKTAKVQAFASYRKRHARILSFQTFCGFVSITTAKFLKKFLPFKRSFHWQVHLQIFAFSKIWHFYGQVSRMLAWLKFSHYRLQIIQTIFSQSLGIFETVIVELPLLFYLLYFYLIWHLLLQCI